LKHGNPVAGNPTVPKGFRSVAAPVLLFIFFIAFNQIFWLMNNLITLKVALPPEQKRAPMRKEFQVQHIKQTWIDPK
jgi:hypothetical protein